MRVKNAQNFNDKRILDIPPAIRNLIVNSRKSSALTYIKHNIRAVTRDFQQCGILTRVDSGEPLQPTFKLRNSK